jgi:DNA-binding NtrC family response regulator
MITAHGHVDSAVEAMKAGATDYLVKPIDYPSLRALLDAIVDEVVERREARAILDAVDDHAGSHGLVGRSRAMRSLFHAIEQLAASDATVLLTGESGTGKEVVARAIHALSRRREGQFVAVNAAAIPEGLIESEVFGHEIGAFTGATRARPGCFELADGGTLLLDEIADMPLSLQPKLLRILEDGRARRLGGSTEVGFDVRVVAATNRSPPEAIREGRLRADLYYRLGVFEIELPPLRNRPEDIRLLAHHFVREFARRHGMAVEGIRQDACSLLEAHPWPGNVRELRNVMERAVILARSDWVETRHLPAVFQSLSAGGAPTVTVPLGTSWADVERTLILRTLERVGNNKSEAARQLGLDVKTIRTKLRAYQSSA